MVSNIIIWWSVFVMSAIVFIWMGKMFGSVSGIVNYFIIQESMGLLFLFLSGSMLQFMLLLIKSGVSPFHFWIFSVGLDLKDFMLMWFLVIQKLPFIPVIACLYEWVYFYVLVLGLFICHLQYFVLSSDSKMVMISSTESFGWLILLLCWGYWSYLVLVGFYMMAMMILLGGLSKDFYAGSIGWEGVLMFMNFPLGLVFLSKYYAISLLSSQNFLLLLLFFSVVLVYMCLMLWVLCLMMTKGGPWGSKMSIYLIGLTSVLMLI
uniref:NADH dehydrogenase subunit 2 n=1 Tax=Philometroides sanguineus TaxID=378106 RepID=A0A0U1XDU9_9BILA|nr:NADH dehydrogenase subunit 2 [Philometroides sanguineus]AIN37111.1 NADH dehydrogenase subunit 2 [Philometroides sanguineus]